MKIRPSVQRRNEGNLLLGAVVVMAIMGLVLFTYLSMVGGQTKLTARSQTWNMCMALAEAGVEEALAHLNQNGISTSGKIELGMDLAKEGWTFTTNTYWMRRQIDDGYYVVTILPGARPLITSSGYMPAPAQVAAAAGPVFAAKSPYPWESGKQFIARTVQVTVRGIGKFSKAIVARDEVQLNGKYIKVDSYHSYDPNGSAPTENPWGVYDAAKRRDNADVALVNGFKDDIDINNAKVWGKVATGPDGDVKVKGKATVGSLAWHAAGNLGIEDGWSSNDANFDMPLVEKPFNNGNAIPTAGLVGTNFYDFIFVDGDYKVNKLFGSVYVAGNARVLVTSKIEFKDGANDDDGIEIEPNAHLEIYMQGGDAKLVGKKHKKKNPLSNKTGFNTDGNTTNFFYFGLEKHTKLELSKMDTFNGIIYAPNAEVILKAGSIKYYRCEVSGSIQGRKVKLEKNATFHYDENIGSLPADSYVIESWKEI